MNEILDILENDEADYDVYVEPLDEGNVTDEDSGDDEDPAMKLGPEHLSGKQLSAPAGLRYWNKKDIEDKDEEDEENEGNEEPMRKMRRVWKKPPVKPKGKKEDKFLRKAPFPQSDFSAYNKMSEVEL